MKTILLFTIFLTMTISLTGQSKKNIDPIPNNYFIQKSKNQRELGYVLLGVGTVAFITPIIVYASEPYFDITEISPIGPISMLVGAAMIATSIPLFIISGSNKRKGMSVSIKNEAIPYYQQGALLSKNVPSLTLKIGL